MYEIWYNLFALLDDAPVLQTLAEIHVRNKGQDPKGRRFTDFEKDICSFEYLSSGRDHYKYLTKNMYAMSSKTIQRHLQLNTIDVREGIIDVKGLKNYLIENKFPLAVTLCEDGTRITPKVEYDCALDSLRGLVSPLNENGLPNVDLFSASSPFKMADDIKKYPVGNYAYVQLAIPLSKDAAPYVLYHACTDNRFSATDVQNRWKHTADLLHEEEIEVVGIAADGDPRVHRPMRINADFNLTRASSLGPWYVASENFGQTSYFQDMPHTAQKMKNRLVHSNKHESLKIGNYTATTAHLKAMIKEAGKDKHLLTISDIETKDRMRFGPTMKLMNPDLTKCLIETISESKGTVLYLNTMRRLYASFATNKLTPEERILENWTATLTIRGWRNWCVEQPKGLKQFITSNTYVCIELNAHSIIQYIRRCREIEKPEQFINSAIDSQHCEAFFRQLRSLSTTNQTVVNFSIKQLSERISRIHHKLNIMYHHKDRVEFPAITKMQQRSTPRSLPSDEEIIKIVEKAHIIARDLLKDVGITNPNFQAATTLTHRGKQYESTMPAEIVVEDYAQDQEEDEDFQLPNEWTDTEFAEYDNEDTSSSPLETEFVKFEEHPDASGFDFDFGQGAGLSKDSDCLNDDKEEDYGHQPPNQWSMETDTSSPFETEFVQFEEHPDASGVEFEVAQEEGSSEDANSINDGKDLYELDKLFPECKGRLNLKNTTAGHKHTFRLQDRRGNIRTVKKSTIVWMLTEGNYKLSADRTRRFKQNEYRPRNQSKSKWAGAFCRHISTVLGLRWELRGADILSRDEAYVIVSNHQSSLDILGMFDFWHVMQKCTVIAKKELLYTGPFGVAAWLAGLIYIDRKNPAKAHSVMNDCTDMLKEKRIKLWVFPEGTRRNTNEIHAFKKGAFHVAVSSQLPIMPVVYSSYSTFLDDKAKILNNGHVIVTTLEPIETKGLTTEDIPALMERVRNVMIETFKATSKEIEVKYGVNGNGLATTLNSGGKGRFRYLDELIKPKLGGGGVGGADAGTPLVSNGSSVKQMVPPLVPDGVHRRKD